VACRHPLRDLFQTSTAEVLKILAREHSDDTVRFNAVMLLDEAGQLKLADLEAVLSREADPDAQLVLLELARVVSPRPLRSI
jgi:hypothetical protein